MEPFDAVIDYLREGRSGTLATIISRVGAAVNEVYGSFFHGDFPARSTVEVSALPRGALVEIEAVACR